VERQHVGDRRALRGRHPTEAINYSGTAGYYYWRIYSYSGSGSYSLCIKKPS
jgi:hypothetical protein